MTTPPRSTQSRPRTRVLRAVLASAAILSIACVPFAANADTADVEPTQTGCLDKHGKGAGQIYNVATGSEPRRDCRTGDAAIHLAAGDITAVAAGPGLRAISDDGGIVDAEGSAQLDLAPAYRLPQGCLAERMVVQSVAGWACRSIPPATPTQIVAGTSGREAGGGEVADDLAYLSDPLQVPAGSWSINAEVSIDTDEFVRCRLDVAGTVGVDFAGTSTAARLPLSSTVTSPTPFTVALACEDDGTAAEWDYLNFTAVQGTSLDQQTLPQHS